jgi:hypothetical protein
MNLREKKNERKKFKQKFLGYVYCMCVEIQN